MADFWESKEKKLAREKAEASERARAEEIKLVIQAWQGRQFIARELIALGLGQFIDPTDAGAVAKHNAAVDLIKRITAIDYVKAHDILSMVFGTFPIDTE